MVDDAFKAQTRNIIEQAKIRGDEIQRQQTAQNASRQAIEQFRQRAEASYQQPTSQTTGTSSIAERLNRGEYVGNLGKGGTSTLPRSATPTLPGLPNLPNPGNLNLPKPSIPLPKIPSSIPMPPGGLAGAAGAAATAVEALNAIGKAGDSLRSLAGVAEDTLKAGGSKEKFRELRRDRANRDPSSLTEAEKEAMREKGGNPYDQNGQGNVPKPEKRNQPDGPGPVPTEPFDYNPFPQVQGQNTVRISFYSPNNGMTITQDVMSFSVQNYTDAFGNPNTKILTTFWNGNAPYSNQNGPDIDPATLQVTPLLTAPLPPYQPAPTPDQNQADEPAIAILPPLAAPSRSPAPAPTMPRQPSPAPTPAPDKKPTDQPKIGAPVPVPSPVPSPTQTPAPDSPTSPNHNPSPAPAPKPGSSPTPSSPPKPEKPKNDPFPQIPWIPIAVFPAAPSTGTGTGTSTGGSPGIPGGSPPTNKGGPCQSPCAKAQSAKLDEIQKKINATSLGGDAALMAKLELMDAKLGAQLPGGGIAGFLQSFKAGFDKLATWLHLDRVLNVLTFTATIHNAYMLSNGLSQTLFSMFSNVLAAVGIKDKDGSPLNIGEIVGNTVEGFAKSVLGVETVDGIKATWKKYSRIYQAAANIIWSVQSIGYSIISILEIVGSMTGKIGNALKGAGTVFERAYQWFNPQPNYQNRFFTAIQKTEDVVSQIDSAASEVLSVQDTFANISQQKTDLEKALSDNPDATGTRSASSSIGSSKSLEEASAIKAANASLPQILSTDQVKPSV